MNLMRKIFGNLALDFSLLLILAALVAMVSLLGLKQVDSNYQQLVSHSVEIERLASQIKVNLLETVRFEDTFLLNLEREGYEAAYENYVVKHNRYTDNLEQDLQELARLLSQSQLAGDEKITADLAQLTDAVITYRQDFATIVALLEKRGTSQSGLEGKFRAKAQAIEEILKQHDTLLSLQIASLELRFFEENYLIHRSAEYVEQVNLHYHKLYGEVEDASIPRREKTELEHLLDEYDTHFMSVVRIDTEIIALQQEINGLVANIEALANDVDTIARNEAMAQQSQARHVAAQTTQLVIMTVVVIVVFGSGLGVAMAYQIKKGADLSGPAIALKGSEAI
jgi:CHASE3 domain sensor protein